MVYQTVFVLFFEFEQVLENLRVAAKLRLPTTDSSNVRMSGARRDREIRSVVDEVLALMALNKVAHLVSWDRTFDLQPSMQL